MDLRAILIEIHSALQGANVEHALIGGLALAELDLERVREYFRLFDREKELDALLAERRTP